MALLFVSIVGVVVFGDFISCLVCVLRVSWVGIDPDLKLLQFFFLGVLLSCGSWC